MLVFLLSTAFLLCPLRFSLRLRRARQGLLVILRFYGITVLRRAVTWQTLSRRKKTRLRLTCVLRAIRDHVVLEYLRAVSRIGTGDAFSTAVISGGFFGFLSSLTASRPGKCYLEIEPEYGKRVLELEFDCTLTTDPANVLLAILEIWRGRKHGKASH